MPVILTLGRWKQEAEEFKFILILMANWQQAWVTWGLCQTPKPQPAGVPGRNTLSLKGQHCIIRPNMPVHGWTCLNMSEHACAWVITYKSIFYIHLFIGRSTCVSWCTCVTQGFRCRDVGMAGAGLLWMGVTFPVVSNVPGRTINFH